MYISVTVVHYIAPLLQIKGWPKTD